LREQETTSRARILENRGQKQLTIWFIAETAMFNDCEFLDPKLTLRPPHTQRNQFSLGSNNSTRWIVFWRKEK
jgi:hypothetical protein